MPRSYFEFKQFTVHQDMCAMKVCTDACIFGAYIDTGNAQHILDIGTGTGLLSLMLAQRSNAGIWAVEIDKNASIQASENIDLSPWKDRIQVVEADIRIWQPGNNPKFDLIVSNPPFFQNHLKSPEQARNKAKHDYSLTLDELALAVENLLDTNGRAYVLLPPNESCIFETKIHSYGFNLCDTLEVKNNIEKPVFRVISGYSKQQTEPVQRHQFIIKEENDYTGSFKILLKDYYL